MQELPVKRSLSEEDREEDTVVGGELVSIYRKGNEVIITDTSDSTRIYMVCTTEFWSLMETGDCDY